MIFENAYQEDLPQIADAILPLFEQTSVFCLYGEMGSGKTTLVKSICLKLGISEISSPTYPIINEYAYPGGTLYHIDLYRLKSIQEAASIGLDEYLYSGNICFIEWPDNFESMLPGNHIKIFIRKLGEHSRNIEIAGV
jgi:tRNA threonylcarbamoyladenosine biosynthesis protein TsaE